MKTLKLGTFSRRRPKGGDEAMGGHPAVSRSCSVFPPEKHVAWRKSILLKVSARKKF